MKNNSIFGITLGMTFAYLGCLWNTRKAACNKLIRFVIYMWTIGFGIFIANFWILSVSDY